MSKTYRQHDRSDQPYAAANFPRIRTRPDAPCAICAGVVGTIAIEYDAVRDGATERRVYACGACVREMGI